MHAVRTRQPMPVAPTRSAHAGRSWRPRVRYLLSLRGLPPRVARFLQRAHRHALRTEDAFSLASAIRPRELSALITLARGRQTVVELGTGTAWSAIALARADETRRLITYDPVTRPEREAYLELAGGRVRDRIELREEPDTAGARAGESVELLFVDSSHDRDSVIAAFRAWRTSLMHGAPVVFHDYGNPAYPGVREAVTELRLAGEESYGLFVWRAP